jgi:hypothetical protein
MSSVNDSVGGEASSSFSEVDPSSLRNDAQSTVVSGADSIEVNRT